MIHMILKLSEPPSHTILNQLHVIETRVRTKRLVYRSTRNIIVTQ